MLHFLCLTRQGRERNILNNDQHLLLCFSDILYNVFLSSFLFCVYSAEPTPAGTELQISPRQQSSEPLKSSTPPTTAACTAAAAAAWLQTPGATAASQERRQWASHGHQRGSVASCGGRCCWWRKTTTAAATSEASGIQVVLCPRPYRTADSTAATKSKGEPLNYCRV